MAVNSYITYVPIVIQLISDMQQKKQDVPDPAPAAQTEQSEEVAFIKALRSDCVKLSLIDAKYEKEKYIMKDLNIMDYIISILEHMIKKKQHYASKTVADFVLEYAQHKYHLENDTNEQLKSFVTSLLYSYQKNAYKSAELIFIKRFLQDSQRRSAASVQFYLRLRKTIVSNFLSETRKSLNTLLDGQQIKFEDWSTLVTRFLGANFISIIGTRVKDLNLKTKVYDRILQNSIDACSLIEFCQEEYEKTQPAPISIDGESLAVVQKQKKPKEVVEQQAALTPTKKSNAEDSQQKVLANLHEQKYKLLDEKIKQTMVFNQTLKIHESLAEQYNTLQDHTMELRQLLLQIQGKIRKGQNLQESDQKAIDSLLEFNDFIEEDPRVTLQKSGIYEFIKS